MLTLAASRHQEQTDAGHDGHVGDIEDAGAQRADTHVHEVDDPPSRCGPVNQVSNSPTSN
jgi:hypothetical protein